MSALITGRPAADQRKAAERFLGQYVFIYNMRGRSMPGDVIQVTDEHLILRESNHDRWPDTLVGVKFEDIFEIISADETTELLGEATEAFSAWRHMLNGPSDEAWAETEAKQVREKAKRKADKEAKILKVAKEVNATS